MILFFTVLLNLSAKTSDAISMFECTAIEIIDKSKAKLVLGDREFPPINLRRSANEGWLFYARGKEYRLASSMVEESIDFGLSEYRYQIRLNSSTLEVHLKGIPPSRNGTLIKVDNPLGRGSLIAKVTCH